MNPRNFLNFFKTPSGRLILFVVLFGVVLLLFSHFRKNSDENQDVHVTSLTTNANDKPQVVQTYVRPLQAFHPPPPKAESPALPMPEPSSQPQLPTLGPVQPRPILVFTNEPTKPVGEKQKHEAPSALPPISLFADSSAGLVEPKTLGPAFAPYGRLISCETIVTVDSASIQTPIIGLVTENVYHAGKLVIPAGTEVHGSAQSDHHRERIASGNNWTFVWQTGEELRIRGIALDREFSGDQEGWGITDGSAGLVGKMIKSDDLAEIKLFAATFLSGAAEALTEKDQTIFGSVDSASLNNAPFKGAEKVLSTYAQRIYDSIQRDGFYVRVPSGKQFYIYVLQTIDRSDAILGGSFQPFAEEKETNAPSWAVGATRGAPGKTEIASSPSTPPSKP